MTKDEALRLAFEALELANYKVADYCNGYTIEEVDEAITAIKAALEAKDEPIAFFDPQEKGFYWAKPMKIIAPITVAVEPMPLYTTPPQRTWVGLTYEDMTKLQKDLYDAKGESVLPTTFAMAVEAKLKEKNT